MSVAPTPRFPAVAAWPVENARTGESYTLVRSDGIEATPERLLELAARNNEPRVYEELWRGRLNGGPYPPEFAAKFFEWAGEGWRNGTHFVFSLLSPKGEIGGAIDIKSANLEEAEIGYWLSEAHSGVMTNAVLALAEIAREAGYKRLFARVRPSNERSAAVLRRAGFSLTGEVREGEQTYLRFDLDLPSP